MANRALSTNTQKLRINTFWKDFWSRMRKGCLMACNFLLSNYCKHSLSMACRWQCLCVACYYCEKYWDSVVCFKNGKSLKEIYLIFYSLISLSVFYSQGWRMKLGHAIFYLTFFFTPHMKNEAILKFAINLPGNDSIQSAMYMVTKQVYKYQLIVATKCAIGRLVFLL